MSVIISYHIPHIHHITHIAPLVVVFGRRPGREIWELPVVVSVRFAQGQKERKRQGQTCTQCWALPMPQWLKLSQIDSMNSQWTLNELSMNSQWTLNGQLLAQSITCSDSYAWTATAPATLRDAFHRLSKKFLTKAKCQSIHRWGLLMALQHLQPFLHPVAIFYGQLEGFQDVGFGFGSCRAQYAAQFDGHISL